jgi:hypothetical protein
LCKESSDLIEVAVFRGKYGHPQSHTQSERSDQGNQNWKKQHRPCHGEKFLRWDEKFVDAEVAQKKHGLDRKPKERRDAIGNWINQSGVINLLINPGISSENRCISGKAGREVTPNNQPGIVKEQGGEAFRWNLSEFPENKGENNGEEKGLENKPSGAKNGLFVLGKKVPANK